MPNPTLELVPGMYADASLVLEQANDVARRAGPGDRSHGDEARACWSSAATDKLEPRDVTLGLETADRVEVTAGLRDGRPGRRRQPRAAQAGHGRRRRRSRRRAARRGSTLMSRFSIRNPYFIIVVCLIVAVIGLTSLVRMPVDLFPDINIPQVVVATFYNGMPPEQIETDITGPVRAVLHARRRHRSHRVALAARREHHQGVLPAGHQRRLRRRRDLEPGDGRPAAAAAGHAAADRAEVRRLEPAGLPGHAQGRGAERDRSCATSGSSRSATSSRACPARRCRRPSAASTGRSWSTSIRRSCRRTS